MTHYGVIGYQGRRYTIKAKDALHTQQFLLNIHRMPQTMNTWNHECRHWAQEEVVNEQRHLIRRAIQNGLHDHDLNTLKNCGLEIQELT